MGWYDKLSGKEVKESLVYHRVYVYTDRACQWIDFEEKPKVDAMQLATNLYNQLRQLHNSNQNLEWKDNQNDLHYIPNKSVREISIQYGRVKTV